VLRTEFFSEFVSVGEVEFGEGFVADIAGVVVVDAYACVVVGAFEFEEAAVAFAAECAYKAFVTLKIFV